MDKSKKLPRNLVLLVVASCILPYLLMLSGVEFGNPPQNLDYLELAQQSTQVKVEAEFKLLSGAFTHTLLEWTAFCIAGITVILAFSHYRINNDLTTPIIAAALFCAGCLDAFHTLAADRLIESVADNQNLIPFTWAISRTFNVSVLILGVVFLLFFKKKQHKAGIGLIASACTVFLILAFAIINFCATKAELPQTMFPDNIITRPWDVGPLLLYIFAACFLLPVYYKRFPSIFAYSLIISMLPNIASGLHMAFGSQALFDSHFNIGHFLKIIAYATPTLGLILDYVHSYETQRADKDKIAKYTDSLLLLSQITQVANKTFASKDILQLAVDEICKYINWPVGHVYKYDENLQKLTSTEIWHLADKSKFFRFKDTTQNTAYKSGHGLPGAVLQDFKPCWIEDLNISDDFKRGSISNVISAFAFPVLVDSKVVYVMEFYQDKPMKRDKGLLALMFDIGLQLGQVVEREHFFNDLMKEQLKREKANELLEERTKALENSNMELERFAYIASHDLQEPLRMVASYTGLLASRYKDKLDQDANEFIGFAVDGARRMQSLIQDLLTFSKIGTIKKELTEIDCNKMLKDITHDFELLITENNCEVSYKNLPTIMAERVEFHQLIQNLLSNAIKYSDKERKNHIVISATKESNNWQFKISDTGIGIEDRFFKQIFEIFRRLHGKTEYSGTGIGLAVCKRIVDKYNGEIWVESDMGKGSTFYFTL